MTNDVASRPAARTPPRYQVALGNALRSEALLHTEGVSSGGSGCALERKIAAPVFRRGGSEFEQLEKREESLRHAMQKRGAAFSGGDRLTRDELYERHALP